MKTPSLLLSGAFCAAILFATCKKEEITNVTSQPEASNAPVLPSRTYDYMFSENDSLAELGRVLFYDKNLSLNNSVSCGSCHQQAKAFCDNMQFSTGLEDQKTSRNSPSIFAKNGPLFWDGRARSMTELVLMPVQNHVEMKTTDIRALCDKIGRIDYYKPLFRKVFRTNYVETHHLQKAMSEFLKNFDFSQNKFTASEEKRTNLTASEQNGKDIFFGKGGCSGCHRINDNNSGNGGYGTINDQSVFNIGLDYVYTDKGVGALSSRPEDQGKFLIPVLLNVEYTAPYMHDGRFKTLEEVVEHYNSGVKKHGNLDPKLRDFSSLGTMSEFERTKLLDKNKDGRLEGHEVSEFPPLRLGLSENEKRNLVDFLKTLSDPTIKNDQRFSDPFAMK